MIIEWIGRLFRPNGNGDTHRRPVTPPRHNGAGNGDAPLGSVVDPPDMLRAELERARRYEHDLAVVVLSTTPKPAHDVRSNGNGIAPRSTSAGPPQVVSLLAATALREVLRESDILCFQAMENRFVLALAESDADEARGALSRIETVFRERLHIGIEAGVSRFPGDALTLDDLVDTAVERMKPHEPDPGITIPTNGDRRLRTVELPPRIRPTPSASRNHGVTTDA